MVVVVMVNMVISVALVLVVAPALLKMLLSCRLLFQFIYPKKAVGYARGRGQRRWKMWGGGGVLSVKGRRIDPARGTLLVVSFTSRVTFGTSLFRDDISQMKQLSV